MTEPQHTPEGKGKGAGVEAGSSLDTEYLLNLLKNPSLSSVDAAIDRLRSQEHSQAEEPEPDPDEVESLAEIACDLISLDQRFVAGGTLSALETLRNAVIDQRRKSLPEALRDEEIVSIFAPEKGRVYAASFERALHGDGVPNKTSPITSDSEQPESVNLAVESPSEVIPPGEITPDKEGVRNILRHMLIFAGTVQREGITRPANGGAISTDGLRAAVAHTVTDENGFVSQYVDVLETDSGVSIGRVPFQGDLKGLAFSQNGERLFIGADRRALAGFGDSRAEIEVRSLKRLDQDREPFLEYTYRVGNGAYLREFCLSPHGDMFGILTTETGGSFINSRVRSASLPPGLGRGQVVDLTNVPFLFEGPLEELIHTGGLSFLPDENALVASATDGELRRIPLDSLNLPVENENLLIFPDQRAEPFATVFHPDGTSVVCWTGSGRLALYRLDESTDPPMKVGEANIPAGIEEVRFNGDGTQLLVQGEKEVRVYRLPEEG